MEKMDQMDFLWFLSDLKFYDSKHFACEFCEELVQNSLVTRSPLEMWI